MILESRYLVMSGFKAIDPDATEQKKSLIINLKRRKYLVKGVSDIWHADKLVKLKLYGCPFHAGIDCFLRKVLWLKLLKSNNKPISSAYYFHETVNSLGEKQPQDVFDKKGGLKNFAKFAGKHLHQLLFFNKIAHYKLHILLKTRFWHRFFPVNFAKFLKPSFLQNTSGWQILFRASSNSVENWLWKWWWANECFAMGNSSRIKKNKKILVPHSQELHRLAYQFFFKKKKIAVSTWDLECSWFPFSSLLQKELE